MIVLIFFLLSRLVTLSDESAEKSLAMLSQNECMRRLIGSVVEGDHFDLAFKFTNCYLKALGENPVECNKTSTTECVRNMSPHERETFDKFFMNVGSYAEHARNEIVKIRVEELVDALKRFSLGNLTGVLNEVFTKVMKSNEEIGKHYTDLYEKYEATEQRSKKSLEPFNQILNYVDYAMQLFDRFWTWLYYITAVVVSCTFFCDHFPLALLLIICNYGVESFMQAYNFCLVGYVRLAFSIVGLMVMACCTRKKKRKALRRIN